MLNKKLVLGSLAGATLLVGAAFMLPSAATAGIAGTCANCHTMHDSVGGANQGATGAQDNLLLFQGCNGCHTGADNGVNNRDVALPYAPQVGAAVTGANENAGGYFSGTAANEHTFGTQTAPGGGPAFTGTVPFECESCHGDSQHHGGSASYRFLNADTDNDGTADGGTVTMTTSDPDYRATVYNGVNMNAFCADCHGGFHGAANTAANTTGTATGDGPWVRHPVDVISGAYDNLYGSAGNPATQAMPLGGVLNDATGTVMCTTCHKAHGSDFDANIRFNYAANLAGGTAISTGCEECHGAK